MYNRVVACRERKNVNLPGVIVDLPTLTKKDEEDLTKWGLINDIDFIAASFVRKGSDVTNIRKVSCAVTTSILASRCDKSAAYKCSAQHSASTDVPEGRCEWSGFVATQHSSMYAGCTDALRASAL